MSGKKPSNVKGFIIVREFRGTSLYLASTHIGKGYRWLANRAQAMIIPDAQDALAISERASREWGSKAFVATTDEAPHIVERATERLTGAQAQALGIPAHRVVSAALAPYQCVLCGQRIDDGKPCGCGARSVQS